MALVRCDVRGQCGKVSVSTSAERSIPAGDVLTMPFGKVCIGDGKPALVIAEIGINHEGSLETCTLMVEAAVRAGADAVKLQTSDPDEHYLPGTPSYELYDKARLLPEETAAIFAQAKKLGVEIFTTCGDIPTLELIESLDPAGHKISSGMLVNLPMIRRFAKTGRSLIFSSGMSELNGIDAAIEAARGAGADKIAVLQCTSLYPAPPETLNLRAIRTLRERYGVLTGLSDHSTGTKAAELAVAAGACIIEKHFTFDRGRDSFDHKVSLEPGEFAAMVKAIRRAETMLGTGVKAPVEVERERARMWTRQLVARRDIKARQRITEDDLAIKRTAAEARLPELTFDDAIGLIAKRDLRKFSVISRDDVEG